MELRFRCPEDVQNTLIHHTKIKFMENVAAKLTHTNMSRMSIIGTQKKCREIVWSRESQVLSVPVVRLETECGAPVALRGMPWGGHDAQGIQSLHQSDGSLDRGTAWGMWMVGGPVELRHRMSLQWTALSMRSLKNGKRSGEPKCGPTLRRSEASVEKCTPTSTPTTFVF